MGRDPVADSLTNELDILLAARGGSQEAGRRLMSEHGPSMVRTAWNVLGRYGGHEADDVVQEAFIAALTTRALPTGDLGAWLRAITARKALDAVRRSGRRAETPLAGGDDAGRELASPDDSSSRVEVLAVRKALRALSATDRAVLTLVDLEGYTMAEAAEALGATTVAIRLRAVRARRKLARLLRDDRVDPDDRAERGLEGEDRR